MKAKKISREDENLEYDNIYNAERDELYSENLPSIWYNWPIGWEPIGLKGSEEQKSGQRLTFKGYKANSKKTRRRMSILRFHSPLSWNI